MAGRIYGWAIGPQSLPVSFHRGCTASEQKAANFSSPRSLIFANDPPLAAAA
jgi:hypothetical protein